ncbi:MAG: response regulator transcription factor [Chloroflexi bacterium AL-W]|nr:response regulator transcription factor [Chloroflexi bacterium AL-N1]NOK68800.1 response regulator transcription factor [Chloroflexi bacterium AL-N10]NOK76286.1 response regulator transcription factor [Chloroflexi bacterium AL-N5]NOK84077.1 response regulator transcription factor [Chloroflexi bacterium AL-W]NOK91424.1 response regulator transcription factor [Chloroflexi bacterium AL-N15]
MSSCILVVDDDPAVLHGVATLLEQAGYETRQATTGVMALEKLVEQPHPSLVVLDVMLPGFDGYTVCRRIRAMSSYIPVLMLSARDEVIDKVTGLELGADEYVTKPFEPRELLARIRAMLRFAEQSISSQHTEEQPLTYGALTLWRTQHRVEIHGESVDLTPKEWALLELLMEHPGQVFGRETLLRRIWDEDFYGEPRTVDVHIQRLRAKLGAETASGIETVRGFGYRLAQKTNVTL